MIPLEWMPPLMFGGLVVFMIIGYPVSFSLAAVGFFFGFLSIEMGYFTMAFMQATFSLPGLAGLALTIGMAVDANVLVFERMREEKERGASLAQQIRNGFNRAWITTLDSHVTNFLAAVVLYVLAGAAAGSLYVVFDIFSESRL